MSNIHDLPRSHPIRHIVDPAAPYDTARLFRDTHFANTETPTLFYHRGGFYRWSGTAYDEFADADLRATIYDFLDQCRVVVHGKAERPFEQPFKPTKHRVANIIDALQAAANLPAEINPPAWLEGGIDIEPATIISCANGLLDLETLDLLAHTATWFSHNSVPWAYDKRAPEPQQWLGFLDQLWPDDQDAIATLQEIFGLCLTTETRFQKAFLLIGPKRSGKGTIARVLGALVGRANAASPTLASLGDRFGLQPLIGKLLAIISDARLGTKADQHAIAESVLRITGEDDITADRKNRDAWTGRFRVRFLVISNELPRLADASGAVASRFIILRLVNSFYGREDLTLTDQLLTELPSILNWSLKGWQRLKERGYFRQPPQPPRPSRKWKTSQAPSAPSCANAAGSDPNASSRPPPSSRPGTNGANPKAATTPEPSKPLAATSAPHCQRWPFHSIASMQLSADFMTESAPRQQQRHRRSGWPRRHIATPDK